MVAEFPPNFNSIALLVQHSVIMKSPWWQKRLRCNVRLLGCFNICFGNWVPAWESNTNPNKDSFRRNNIGFKNWFSELLLHRSGPFHKDFFKNIFIHQNWLDWNCLRIVSRLLCLCLNVISRFVFVFVFAFLCVFIFVIVIVSWFKYVGLKEMS